MTVNDRIIQAETGYIAQTLKRLKLIATKDLTDSPVLFTGPTGSGKEVLANYLVEHIPDNSSFLKINCITLPKDIIESELFGHTKGAFTGADNEHTGLIEKSADGVLFLDEIGVLSEQLQVKLLRVLEDREVRKIGDSKSKKINVRFIAATNRDVIPDLKHRFSYKINIPPLREIPEEIPYLLQHFLGGPPFRQITVGTLLSMAHTGWEGNVRELKNFLKEAEISLELINQEVGKSTSKLAPKEGLFDIVLLFEKVSLSLERYWTIRAFTTFDEMLLKDIPAVKKIKMDSLYEFHQARSLWRTEEGSLSISLRTKAPDALKDELCLDLNENFPVKAEILINKYVDLLDERTSKRLESFFNDPEIFVNQQRQLYPGIQPNERVLRLLKKPQLATKAPGLFELPWKQAKENFGKAYWDRIHSDNPGRSQKQVAEMMGISEQSYQKMKLKFNKKALKANKNETKV